MKITTKLLETLMDTVAQLIELLGWLARLSLKLQKMLFGAWADRVRKEYNIKDDKS